MADERLAADGDHGPAIENNLNGNDDPTGGQGSSLASENPALVTPAETREEILSRHRKEVKELQAKEIGMKKNAAKGSKAKQKAKKKEVDEEIARLDAKMKARHMRELAGLDGSEGRKAEGRTDTNVGSDLDSLVRMVAGVGIGKGVGGEGRISKAQKRREKRSQQELEREQRIGEEQGSVPSKKAVEDGQFLKKLLPLGLQVKEVKPDGHCLYRAVEDQLRLRAPSYPTNLDSAVDFRVLRASAAQYMREHVDDFLPFVLAEAAGEEGEEASSMERFEQYCSQLESTAAWGGHLELQALAKVLHRPITVISADLPDVDIGQEFATDLGVPLQPPIRLSYHRHAFGLGEHYNSVVPLPQQLEGSSTENLLEMPA